MLLLRLRRGPRSFLLVCRDLKEEAGQPDGEADDVAGGELREGGGGNGVSCDDGEGDEGYPSCLGEEGNCELKWLRRGG